MAYAINEIVSKTGTISIEGNIVPNEWYKHLRNKQGKVQVIPALLLADIVFWYRPVPLIDIKTGLQIGYGKKFKEDLLQKSYEELESKFNFSKKQIREALIFLEKENLIFREFRNIKVNGQPINNVMYLGIYPEKIKEITDPIDLNSVKTSSTLEQMRPLTENDLNILPKKETYSSEKGKTNTEIIPGLSKVKDKDWSMTFSKEEKEFLSYLLEIKPYQGDKIEKNNATWWIKEFGINKIKIALQVYWQRVERAQNNSKFDAPKAIGACIRDALNKGSQPLKIFKTKKLNCKDKDQASLLSPSLIAPFTPTQLMPRANLLNEDISIVPKKEAYPSEKGKTNTEIIPGLSKVKDKDWSMTFSKEEKEFLSYLLKIVPQVGDFIKKDAATWWIKKFGIEKIKIALQVYWQQIEKANINSKVPFPSSIGAYVRRALDAGIQPCKESDKRNKAFAKSFKEIKQWKNLTITEKYCRVEEFGKEWYYHMPESLFTKALISFHESYCEYSEKSIYQTVV